MKHFYTSLLKITLCFVLLCGASSRSNAQYQSLLDTSFQWNVMHCFWGVGPSCYTDYFKPGNDTVINAINYKILMTFDSLHPSGMWRKHGYLREDSIAEKVYYLGLSQSSEELLYDFSVSVGDTINSMHPVQCFFVVTGIDTVNINSVNRRRIIMSSTNWGMNEVWLSGIGNVRGLLENGTNSCMTDYSSTLLCFHDNNILKYQDSTTTTCYIESLGLKEYSSIGHTVAPNPAIDQVKIEFNNTGNYKTVITIYNQLGETVMSKSTTGSTVELSLPAISNGLYFYRISNEKGNASGKLLKQ